jgi:hypothetical protein
MEGRIMRLNRLAELLRDPGDFMDLLEAYGEPVPPQSGAARQRLLEIAQYVGEARMLATLFDFASAFAGLSREIFDFCTEHGTAIRGQVQIGIEKSVLRESSLDSSWAFVPTVSWDDEAEQRAHAIAAAFLEMSKRIEPENIIRSEQEDISPHGLAGDPFEEVVRPMLRRRRHVDRVHRGDLQALRQAAELLSNTQGTLAAATLPAGLASALAEIEGHCRTTLLALHPVGVTGEAEMNPTLAGICDEIQVLCSQAENLAADTSLAERAERGFGDFLRSEFWPQRWRIYELWLLVRTLKVLASGGEVELHGIENGVWNLSYGSARSPCASVTYPEGSADVYYQLLRSSEHGGEMPDIAVLPRSGEGALFILDPKHGASYHRHKVQKVLSRYVRAFESDLTAVVNYTPMKSYEFDLGRSGARRWILASGVGPDTPAMRRLELQLEDVLLARGYGRRRAPAQKMAAAKRARPAKGACVIYWARDDRERDEPCGLWALTEQGGLLHLEALSTALKGATFPLDISFEATADGEVCLVRFGGHLVLLLPNGKLRPLLSISELDILKTEWSPQQTHLLIALSNQLVIFDREGEIVTRIDFPPNGRPGIPEWEPDGKVFVEVKVRKGNSEESLPYWLAGGDCWDPLSREEWRGRVDASLHRDTGLISRSPLGRCQIFDGPSSLRSREGVHLLKIQATEDGRELPLVRFIGRLQKPVSWSPDESRFAFYVRTDEGERRLLVVRVGDRYARVASLPDQRPTGLAWIGEHLLRPFLPQ